LLFDEHRRIDLSWSAMGISTRWPRPSDTFVGLAAVMSFYLVFRGSFDIAMALAASRAPGWWVLLIVGLAELAIASAFAVSKVGHGVAAFDGQHAS